MGLFSERYDRKVICKGRPIPYRLLSLKDLGDTLRKKKIRFYYYARGSVLETEDWFNKARARNLLTDKKIKYINDILTELPKEINFQIRYTLEKLDK